MSDQLEMNFDLTPITVPVTIGGKKYVLKEASGDAAVKYRNCLLKATKLGPEGKPSSIDGMADAEPLLVSLCLFQIATSVNKLGDAVTAELPVPIHVVRGWKNQVQKGLFARIKEISDLDENETKEILEKRLAETQRKLDALNGKTDGEEEGNAKNVPSATTVTSD